MTDEVASSASVGNASSAMQATSAPPSPSLRLDDNVGTDIPTDRSPAQTTFATREELLRYVTDFSLSQGYAVVIHKSNVPRGQLWLRCDMGGSSRDPVPPAEAKRKRKNSSRLQNCPFQLYGRRLLNGTWTLKVQNPQHTHEPAEDTEDLEHHPKARRLTNAQKLLVVEMTDVGIRPSIIVDRLKEKFPGKPIKVRDIYNARNYIRTERRAGRVPYPECRVESVGANARIETSNLSTEQTSFVSVDQQIKNLWAATANSMAGWAAEKKEAFRDDLQRFLEKFNAPQSEAEASNSEQDERHDTNGSLEEDNGQVEEPSSTTAAPADVSSSAEDPAGVSVSLLDRDHVEDTNRING